MVDDCRIAKTPLKLSVFTQICLNVNNNCAKETICLESALSAGIGVAVADFAGLVGGAEVEAPTQSDHLQ